MSFGIHRSAWIKGSWSGVSQTVTVGCLFKSANIQTKDCAAQAPPEMFSQFTNGLSASLMAH